LEYRPERWTREFERGLPKGAYVPFAAGTRVCLGKQFAMMELRIVLGTLIQNVDINLLEGFEPDFVSAISLNPGERGMQMTVRFRDRAPVRTGVVKPPILRGRMTELLRFSIPRRYCHQKIPVLILDAVRRCAQDRVKERRS
jgi:hypothetical protein